MGNTDALYESSLAGLPPPRRGKVRDIYDLGERLLLVATDRISAFDLVLPTPIPGKGRILTALTRFWLNLLQETIPNHLLADPIESIGLSPEAGRELAGRALLVKKARVIPFECIVRGYLSGSGWREYQTSGEVCGIRLPAGLRLGDRLDEPIFTPSTKAETGHDQNVPFQALIDAEGEEVAGRAREAALELYSRAARYAREKGIIIADSKFEFGLAEGKVILIDEVLTPDSSRFWPLESWRPGFPSPSFDKQYLRDWLERESGWNKKPPPPPLPEAVIEATRSRYREAWTRLIGESEPG
ncbi:MAG: phosphoribosylaminoimidazolesuccinocarboxamide synthase [Planctomycetota bacterium]|jgi:phosphoribosylaminoimidazole-succinocarboxamide synthase|nr:phosphoribosylaminoimidazolesuccinocarboxamide synthase [Planctomycetota bacterium]